MSKKTFFEINTVFCEPCGANAAPSVATLPNKNLFAVWSHNPYLEGVVGSEAENVMDITKHPGNILGAFSKDNGKSWSDPIVLAEGADGDPSLFVADNRTILHYSLLPYIKKGKDVLYKGDTKIFEKISSDNGQTWTEAKQLDPGIWGSTGMLKLRDNTLIWPFYYIDNYVDNADSKVLERHMICVSGVLISKDDGKTWERSEDIHVDLENGADEPTVVELTNSDLYMLIRTTGKCQYESVSRDKGKTWSKPEPTILTSPSSTAKLYRLSFEPNKVIVVWNNSPENRYPLDVAISYDDCKSWAYSRTLSNPGRCVIMPSITTAADGSIVIVYHEGPDALVKKYYCRQSIVMAARISEEWMRSGQYLTGTVYKGVKAFS